MNAPARRPWFGPKRIGIGFRPRTWQGWLVILTICGGAGLLVAIRH